MRLYVPPVASESVVRTLPGLKAGARGRELAEGPAPLPQHEGSFRRAGDRRRIPGNPLSARVAGAGTSNEAPSHHQDVPFDIRTRQEIERRVDDGEVASHAPGDPQRPPILRQAPGERAAGRKAHIALHTRRRAVVVEGEQLRHDVGRRTGAHERRIAGWLVGVDNDDAVLCPRGGGHDEQQEETADEESHAELGKW